MSMVQLRLPVLAIILCMVLAGCAGRDGEGGRLLPRADNSVRGLLCHRWKYTSEVMGEVTLDKPESCFMEFMQDGNYVVHNSVGDDQGKWTLSVDGKSVTVDTKGSEVPITYRLAVLTPQRLVLEDTDTRLGKHTIECVPDGD